MHFLVTPLSALYTAIQFVNLKIGVLTFIGESGILYDYTHIVYFKLHTQGPVRLLKLFLNKLAS